MTAPDRPTLAEWLRDAYADPAAGCPPPESFLADELALLTPAQRQQLEAHANGCPACSAERELAGAFDAGAEAAAPADIDWVVSRLRGQPTAGNPALARVVDFRRGRALPTWARLAAAAVFVMAAGLAYYQIYPPLPSLPPPTNGGALRGGAVELLAPVGEVATVPRELRWEPVPGATSYRVTVVMVDGKVLWEHRVDGPAARLPEPVAARLLPGVSYQWGVEATTADGALAGRSTLARFRVRPPPEQP